MVVLHYACVDEYSDYPVVWTNYYIHHRYTGGLPQVHLAVSAQYSADWLYYTHHWDPDPHQVQVDVHLKYSIEWGKKRDKPCSILRRIGVIKAIFYTHTNTNPHTYLHTNIPHAAVQYKMQPKAGNIYIYIQRVSQEECARLWEGVPHVKVYRYNPKHLCPKLNSYGDNGQRSLKLWLLLHTYWLPNTY